MMKSLTSLMALAVLLVLSSNSQVVADVIVGLNDGPNCYPFSCGGSDGLTVYQQVYSSSAFPGPITFNTVSFFKSIGGSMDTDSYVVSFSTTPKPVIGLDPVYTNNLGPDEQFFGSYDLSGKMPDSLVLNGSAFNYNPANGNLLMTVQLGPVQAAPEDYQSFFQADFTGIVTSRLWNGGFNPPGGFNDTGGLVTGFSSTGPVIPEPSSITLLGAGLVATVLAVLRRRRSQSAA